MSRRRYATEFVVGPFIVAVLLAAAVAEPVFFAGVVMVLAVVLLARRGRLANECQAA